MLLPLFLVSLIAVDYASAAVLDDRSHVHRSLVERLQLRQSEVKEPELDPSTVPTQCRQPCIVFINSHNTCNSNGSSEAERLPCFCTAAHGSALKSCLDCVIDAYPLQSQAELGQSILDSYNSMCQAYNLPPYSLSYMPSQSSKPPVSFPSTLATTPSNSIPSFSESLSPSPTPATGSAPPLPGNTNNDNPFTRNAGTAVDHQMPSVIVLGIATLALLL